MFRRRRSTERREWLGAISVVPTSVAIGGIATSTLLTQAQMEEFPGGKVSLILGQLFISPATAPAAATGYGVFVGLYRRIVINSTQIQPDPELNLDYNWIWWDSVFPQIGGTAAADSNASRWVGYFRLSIAQRLRLRWHDFDELVLTVKNSSNSGAAVQYSFATRMRILAGRK